MNINDLVVPELLGLRLVEWLSIPPRLKCKTLGPNPDLGNARIFIFIESECTFLDIRRLCS